MEAILESSQCEACHYCPIKLKATKASRQNEENKIVLYEDIYLANCIVTLKMRSFMENTLNKLLFDFFKSEHMKIHFLGERLADFFSDMVTS